MSFNIKADRTWKKDGVISVEGTPLLAVQGFKWGLDASNFGRDFMGDGESTFTQGGDVKGSFDFDLLHTADLLTSTINTTSKKTAQFWLEQINNISPPILTFIQSLVARESAGSKFARYTIKGRIMKVDPIYNVNNEVDRIEVAGEITNMDNALREST